MKNKLSKILLPIYLITLGTLFLILSNIGYISRLNAFGLLILYQGAGFLEFLISSLAFLHLVSVFMLITLGIIGILNKTGAIEFKKSVSNFSYQKLEKIMVTVLASISAVLLLFVIIFCSVNRVYIGVGAILNFILEAIACVIVWVIDFEAIDFKKKEPKNSEPAREEANDDSNADEVKEPEQLEELVMQDVETPTQKDLEDK